MVVEGIGSEARSLAVMDEIAKIIPNKPIRYVINTHAHYDHAGGLRTYVAKGVTVVTHEMNKPFFEKVWARPRTIAPDLLSKSPRPADVRNRERQEGDDRRDKTIEIYHMKGTSHNVANLLVFMPKEGLVFWGDGYNPPEGNDPRDLARTPEQMIDLYRVITMNNLDVKTIAPAHGAGREAVRQSQEGDRADSAMREQLHEGVRACLAASAPDVPSASPIRIRDPALQGTSRTT